MKKNKNAGQNIQTELPEINGIPVHCAHDAIVPLEKIIGNPRNPNSHPESQVFLLAKIIKGQGWRAPITVSTRSGFIVRGHCRFAAAQKLGLSAVPVDYQDYENEATEWADLIADNRVAELAEMDTTRLRDLLIELDTGAIDMEYTGFDAAALEELMTAAPPPTSPHDDDPDAVNRAEELRKKWKTKTGQLWALDDHRLLCGDSTNEKDVARVMVDEKGTLMNTDPPYGIAYVKNAKSKGQATASEDIENDDLDGVKLQEFLEKIIRVAVPHLVDNAAFYLWHPMLTQGTFFAAAAADILIHRQIIWVKPSMVFGRGDYHWQHELCFYGWRRGNRPPFYGERNQTTIWEIGRENDNVHPTQKPVELFEIPMHNHTRRGEIVYEPFSGSGSQIIAAENKGRRCFAIEIDPGYVAVALERWSTMTEKRPELIDG